MTTSTVFDQSYNSKTTTMLDLFVSSSSLSDGTDDEIMLTRHESSALLTSSLKPQLETSAVWRRSSIYATSSWKIITAPPTLVDTTGNNTAATTFSPSTIGGGSVTTAPMTRFSRSSADVISLTQSAAAAATATLSWSRETTRRPFEPSTSVATTTVQQFPTDDIGVRATTDRSSESHIPPTHPFCACVRVIGHLNLQRRG